MRPRVVACNLFFRLYGNVKSCPYKKIYRPRCAEALRNRTYNQSVVRDSYVQLCNTYMHHPLTRVMWTAPESQPSAYLLSKRGSSSHRRCDQW